MPTKRQVETRVDYSWDWAQNAEHQNLSEHDVRRAYHLHANPCSPLSCKKNCKNNPFCLNGLGSEGITGSFDAKVAEIDELISTVKRDKDVPVGLKNLGATCYINSFLQLWFHNPEFRAAVYNYKPLAEPTDMADRQKIKMVEELQRVFINMQLSQYRSIDPQEFVAALGVDSAEQQDAQEFSKLFMSTVESVFSSFGQVANLSYIVDSLFQGSCDYVTRCSVCRKESVRPSKFFEIDLQIKAEVKALTLANCIDSFVGTEELFGDNRYFCTSCDTLTDAKRSIKLKTLPPHLNFQLLRFVYDRKHLKKQKLLNPIQFPNVLDMSSYLNLPVGQCVYELAAILVHHGPSANSGHYYALIRESDSQKWFQYSDELVKEIEGTSLLKDVEKDIDYGSGAAKKTIKAASGMQVSRGAYMLVYQRRVTSPLPFNNNLRVQCSENLINGHNFEQLTCNVKSTKQTEISSLTTASTSVVSSEPELKRQRLLNSQSDEASSVPTNSDIFPELDGSQMRDIPMELFENFRPQLQVDSIDIEEKLRNYQVEKEHLTNRFVDMSNNVNTSYVKCADEPFVWIPAMNIKSFFSGALLELVEPVPLNMKFVCRHGNLDVEKVTSLKVVAEPVARLIYDFCKGETEPKLTDKHLCKQCVSARCALLQLKSIASEAKKTFAAELRKAAFDSNPNAEGVWIGKLSYLTWVKLAEARLEAQVSSTPKKLNCGENHGVDDVSGDAQWLTECSNIDNAEGATDEKSSLDCSFVESVASTNEFDPSSLRDDNFVSSPSKPKTDKTETKSEGDLSEIGDLTSAANTNIESKLVCLNDDLLCPHGNLCLGTANKKLVTPLIFQQICSFFTGANIPVFQRDTEECSICKLDNDISLKAREEQKTFAHSWKQKFSDLITLKNRPNFEQSNNRPAKIYLLCATFYDNLRLFMRFPERDIPLEICNTCLLCSHNLLKLNPIRILHLETAKNAKFVVTLWPSEWEELKQSHGMVIDCEVSLSLDDNEALISEPAYCESCAADFYTELEDETFRYRNSNLIVAKLASKAVIPTPSSESSAGVAIEGINGTANESFAGRDIRRSLRAPKPRDVDKKQFSVDSETTLHEIKLKLYSEFKASPVDQHLYYQGKELLDSNATLRSLRVLKDATLYLKIDEGLASIIELNEPGSDVLRERGFKGSNLLG